MYLTMYVRSTYGVLLPRIDIHAGFGFGATLRPQTPLLTTRIGGNVASMYD